VVRINLQNIVGIVGIVVPQYLCGQSWSVHRRSIVGRSLLPTIIDDHSDDAPTIIDDIFSRHC
jgi:hypothetical protein